MTIKRKQFVLLECSDPRGKPHDRMDRFTVVRTRAVWPRGAGNTPPLFTVGLHAMLSPPHPLAAGDFMSHLRFRSKAVPLQGSPRTESLKPAPCVPAPPRSPRAEEPPVSLRVLHQIKALGGHSYLEERPPG